MIARRCSHSLDFAAIGRAGRVRTRIGPVQSQWK